MEPDVTQESQPYSPEGKPSAGVEHGERSEASDGAASLSSCSEPSPPGEQAPFSPGR